MKANRIKYPITLLLSFLIFTQSIFAGTPPNIVGQSAFLMERTTGTILYQKNSNIQMYPASTTKVLTSILCIENLEMSETMAKTKGSIQNVPADSSHIGLKVGDTFSILDAIHAVMLGSDNYVSYDLATRLDGSIDSFANRMNFKAKQIGATNSHFINPHGYHDPNHYTTAHDLALIMDYAVENNAFRSIVKSPSYSLTRLNDMAHPITFPSTVKLIDPESPYYRPYTIGGKTGFTKAAGRNLVAVANQDGMELIGVVMKSQSGDFFEDMNALFDYGFENFTLQIKGNDISIENHSFSPWAKDIVHFALEHELTRPNVKSYQSPISKKDFIELLMRTTYLAENKNLEGFSNDLAINHALEWDLIQNTSLLSGFNDSLNRETAASLTTQLLSSLDYKPTLVYSPQAYEDFDLISPDKISSINYLQQGGIMDSRADTYFYPKEAFTLEEGLSLATQLYKLYSNSPYSFINRFKKKATIQ